MDRLSAYYIFVLPSMSLSLYQSFFLTKLALGLRQLSSSPSKIVLCSRRNNFNTWGSIKRSEH